MHSTLTTRTMPQGERVEFWRETIGEMFVPLEFEADDTGAFCADLQHAPMGVLDLMTLSPSAHTVIRSERLARQSDADYFMVSYQISGQGLLRQGDREARQNAGDFVLYDSTRPFQMGYAADFSKHILRIPRSLLNAHFSSPERLCGLTIHAQSGPGILLGGMLNSLANSGGGMAPQVVEPIANALIELVIGGLQSLPQADQCEPSKLQAFHLARVKSYILQNLGDACLNMEKVAQALRMSVSSLYRVFENEPQPLAQWIWSQRLQLCQRDLKNPALKGRNIGDIGFDWGFSNCTHFSRAFKRETGLTPKEFRQQHLSLR